MRVDIRGTLIGTVIGFLIIVIAGMLLQMPLLHAVSLAIFSSAVSAALITVFVVLNHLK